jgi:hypothetical protein
MDKFGELINYICYKVENPKELGKTKLNKILWYSDREFFEKNGNTISGQEYIKLQYGPVPAKIDKEIKELEDNKYLITRKSPYFGKTIQEFISIKEPNFNKFNAEEISIIDKYIELICFNHTAKSISNESHDEIWEMTEIGNIIPFEATLVSELGEITDEDLKEIRAYYNV